LSERRAQILVSLGLPAALKAELTAHGSVSECSLAPEYRFPGTPTVLVLEAMEALPGEAIRRLPESIRLIANLGVGTDNIDIAAARAAGIAVTNTPVAAEDTADLAMTLLLNVFRRTTHYERLLRNDQWAESERAEYFGRSLCDKTLGIIGFGATGQALARRARAFGMHIMYYGPHEKPEAAEVVTAVYCADIAQLLSAADAVSLNCSLNDETRHLIDATRLGQMKAGAVLVNTGRGALIDESALIDALKDGTLAAAGLDVFAHEPDVPEELLALNNVTLLPHVGSCTVECRQAMQDRVVRNVLTFLNSGDVLDEVLPSD